MIHWILTGFCIKVVMVEILCDSDKTVSSTLNIRPFLKTVQVLLFIVSFFKLLRYDIEE